MPYSDAQIAHLILDVLPDAAAMIREDIAKSSPRTLTLQQYRVLSLIRSGVCFGGDLSQNLGITQAAISKTVDNLTKLNWIVKMHCPEDGRKFIVELTPAGSEVFDNFKRQLGGRLMTRIERMNKRNRQELAKGLEALARVLSRDE